MLLRTPPVQHGLYAEWVGPYPIIKVLSNLLYKPEHPRRKGRTIWNSTICLLTELINLEKLPDEGDDQLLEPDAQLSPEEKRQLLVVLE